MRRGFAIHCLAAGAISGAMATFSAASAQEWRHTGISRISEDEVLRRRNIAERAALMHSIRDQLRQHWRAPDVDTADDIKTILRWRLNDDGTLQGSPEIMDQMGVTDENAALAQDHARQAIRAVEMAAPFDVPPNLNALWQQMTIVFDRRL